MAAGKSLRNIAALDVGSKAMRRSDLLLECWALDRKTKLFEEVFGLKVVAVD